MRGLHHGHGYFSEKAKDGIFVRQPQADHQKADIDPEEAEEVGEDKRAKERVEKHLDHLELQEQERQPNSAVIHPANHDGHGDGDGRVKHHNHNDGNGRIQNMDSLPADHRGRQRHRVQRGWLPNRISANQGFHHLDHQRLEDRDHRHKQDAHEDKQLLAHIPTAAGEEEDQSEDQERISREDPEPGEPGDRKIQLEGVEEDGEVEAGPILRGDEGEPNDLEEFYEDPEEAHCDGYGGFADKISVVFTRSAAALRVRGEKGKREKGN